MSNLVSPTQLHYSTPLAQDATAPVAQPVLRDESIEPNLPSTSSSPSGKTSSESRKRKPWGADVGEIKIVIPPRKRAKTAEEKAQREAERTLRNRKAAEGSRQRSKEQYKLIQDQRDSLQQVTGDLHHENEMLRAMLAKAGIQLPTAFTFDFDLLSAKPEEYVISDAAKKKQAKERVHGTPIPSVTSAPMSTTQIKTEPITSLPTPPHHYSPPLMMLDITPPPLLHQQVEYSVRQWIHKTPPQQPYQDPLSSYTQQ